MLCAMQHKQKPKKLHSMNTLEFNTCLPLAFLFSLSLEGPSLRSTPSTIPRSQTRAKVVNPFGAVTTVVETPSDALSEAAKFAQEYSSGAYLHENCDESRFRPYVAILNLADDDNYSHEMDSQPTPVGRELIVPVIQAAAATAERAHRAANAQRQQDERNVAVATKKIEQMSLSNANANKQQSGKIDSTKAKTSTTSTNGNSANASVEKKIAERKDESSTKKQAKVEQSSTSVEVKIVAGNKENDKVDTDKSKGKKKGGKTVVAKPTETPVECEALKAKPQTFDQPNDNIQSIKIEDLIEEEPLKTSSRDENASNESAIPAKGKAKKKPLVDSIPTSKESSVEKEVVNTTTTSSAKKKNKKGKKSSEASIERPPATDESKSDTNSDSQMDDLIKSISKYNVCTDPFSILDAIGTVDRIQCAEIQGSLLKTNAASAIVVQRKASRQENIDSSEADEPKALSPAPSDDQKSTSNGDGDDSFEMEPLVASMHFTANGQAIELDPNGEPLASSRHSEAMLFDPSDGDSSLSYKSTTEDGGPVDENVADRSVLSANSDEYEKLTADKSVLSANSDEYEKLVSESVSSPVSDDYDKCAADKSVTSVNSDEYEQVPSDRRAASEEFEKVEDADESGVDSKCLKIVDIAMLRCSTTSSSSSSSSSSNSSSETEDSGRGVGGEKSTTNSDDKTGDEDSDAAKLATDSDTNAITSDVNEEADVDADVDADADTDANKNNDALPDENQTMAAEETIKPKAQPPPPKQQGNNNYSKKKSRKKRR